MKSRAIAVFLILSMLVAMLAGCGNQEAPQTSAPAESAAPAPAASAPAVQEEKHDPVTLTFWYTVNNTEADEPKAQWYEDTFRLFHEKYPWITIDATATGGNDYLTKVTTEVAAGNAPDVFTSWLTGRLQPFVEGGFVMPLNDIVANSETLSAALTDEAKSFSQYGDDNFYAIPRAKSGEAIIYNKTIFEKYGLSVPTTIAEFDQLCETLMANGVRPLASGGASAWVAAIAYMSIFQQMDENDEMYNRVVVNHEPCFDDPFFVKVAEKYMEYYNKGYYNDNYVAVSNSESKVLLANGECAMMFHLLSGDLILQLAATDYEFGVFNYPHADGPSTEMLGNYDGGVSISSKTKHPEEAALFLEFLFSEERQVAWAENVSCMLAAPNVPYDRSKLAPLMVEVSDFLNTATSINIPWDNPLGTNMGSEFNSTVQSIMFGEDPTTAFQKLNEIVKVEWAE